MDGEVRLLLNSLLQLNIKLDLGDENQLMVSAPNGTLTADISTQIKRLKPLLIQRLKRTAAAKESINLRQIEPAPADRFKAFPLNDIQHAYWIGRNSYMQLGGVSTHYYCEFTCKTLDIEKLNSAFLRLVQHHDMLRAVVSSDGTQRVLENVPQYRIKEQDLSHDNEADCLKSLLKIRGEMSQQLIDCETWPLFDLRAIKLSESEHKLLFSWDFLVVDAWSILNLFKQWRQIYDDPTFELTPVGLTFRDYVLAEQDLKKSKGYLYNKNYWWDRIDQLPPAPTLPVKTNIEVDKKYEFTRRSFSLTREKWQDLRGLANAKAITPTNLMLAAFSEVLTLWSKNRHYCLNLTLFNRLPLHDDVMGLVGDFTSLLITEIGKIDHKTFMQRAEAIQKQFLADYDHKQVSGVELLRELAKRNGHTQTALMPVVFTSTLMINNDDTKSAQNIGLEQFGDMSYGITQTPQVLLDCQLFDSKGKLMVNWDTVEELFEPGVLDAMFRAFENLVNELASNESAWHEQHPLARFVDLSSIQQINQQALSASPISNRQELLHSSFVKQAHQTPDSIAVISGVKKLSYGQLLSASYQVAQQLRANNVQPNELVAVSMNKGWQQIIAVIGVLIAGAAYLPIDPVWPKKRREHLLEFSRVRIVLTDDIINTDYAKSNSLLIIEVSDKPAEAGQEKNFQDGDWQENTAYVIFTSGSTGTPKGVVISHQSAVNTIVAVNQLFNITAKDRVFAISSLSFDLSVYDIFGPLALGAAIVIPTEDELKDPEKWRDLIRSHRVSIWNSAPQWMNMLLDYNGDKSVDDLTSLRLVMMSGDWIKADVKTRIQKLVAGCSVISLGGATEGAIWSIYYPIEDPHPECLSVPYGKPLPGQAMYVFNKQMQDCPAFVTGDIYIGGLGVAMGYLNDEHRTNERFLTHPLTGQRLYWTGDLGRYLSDGNIEFLGREDRQVKLYGHRVELDEISAQLKSHPDIDDAVVQIIETNNNQSLQAYLVTGEPSSCALFETSSCNRPMKKWSLDEMVIQCDEQQLRDLTYFNDFWQALKPLYLASMLDSLLQLIGENTHLELEESLLEAGVKQQFLFLCHKWIEILTDHQWLTIVRGKAIKHHPENTLALNDAIAQFENSFTVDERVDGFYEYIKSCFSSQIGLLRGEVLPLELLFAQSNQKHAASIYKTNPVAVYHNAQLAKILKTLLDERDASEPIRILEVGAGTGAATSSLLAQLPQTNVEYWFTDLSSFFFDQAKQQFYDVDYLHYGLYNINLEPQSQGFSLHSFDFIIGVNVLHDARHIGNTLNHLRELLKPNGHLMMIEGTADTLWQWVTVGYLEGLNDYEDFRAQSLSPLLNLEQWAEQLIKAGFAMQHSFPADTLEKNTAAYFLKNSFTQHVIVARGPEKIYLLNAETIKKYLASLLPGYMVPKDFIGLRKLPLTPNGKVDFSALSRITTASRDVLKEAVVTAKSGTEKSIATIWRDVLTLNDVGIDNNFFDLGGDSLLLTRVLGKLNLLDGVSVNMTDLFAYPTIRTLSNFIDGKENTQASLSTPIHNQKSPNLVNDIAIIGLSGRFPDAQNVEEFWQNIKSGICSVRRLDDQQLLKAGVMQSQLNDKNYVKAGVVLDDMDMFDASFFKMTPREAQVMDPQLRILLECAVAALDDAGYPNEQHGGKVGVFVGKDVSQYFLEHLHTRQELVESLGMMSLINVNEKDYAAAQISYRLNLTGPSLNILTACSTSLVAIHQACKSLLNQECAIAIAGGVSIETNHKGYLHKEGSIASSDGICRAFSEDADGCVRGSGAGIVVLKPLTQALRDNDSIHAVIKGSAINNDGRNKIGFTAPSVQGQATVITAAISDAGISPSDIQYVETHGTGTRLGDPIESKALAQVFNHSSKSNCAIGSLKTNVGHLDAAAGVAGLIKTVCAIKYRKIPPSLNFSSPNPEVDLADGALYVNTALIDWPEQNTGRMAGVSSFGVGGTNAHVILQEAPEEIKPVVEQPSSIVILSAKNEHALSKQAENLREFLLKNPSVTLRDAAYTLQVGRNAYQCRSAWVCDNNDTLINALSSPLQQTSIGNHEIVKLAFMFPGQGSQQLETTYQLYQTQPVFRHNLDKCAELLEMFMQQDIRAWIYADYAASMGLETPTDQQIRQTSYAQPLLFAIEYSMAKYWMSLGLLPDAMIGHSIGEYVAACLAEVFSLEEALSLVVVRGQLMQSVEPGTMLAVRIELHKLEPMLAGSGCDLAAANAPKQCVLSGTHANIEAMIHLLNEQQIVSQKLQTSHAFHSYMMEPILETFKACVEQVTLSEPSIAFVSNLNGDWIKGEQATNPQYWVDHLRNSVRFSDGIQTLVDNNFSVFLEVGTGATLSSLTNANGVAKENIIHSLGLAKSSGKEYAEILNAIKNLWLHGIQLNWLELYGDQKPKRITLPSYAFQRQSYWIKAITKKYDNDDVVLASDEQLQPSNDEQFLDKNHFSRPTIRSEFLTAQNERQAKLVELWQTTLGIEEIGIKDNYFELGGDSLTGITLISRMKAELEINIPMDTFAQLGTIRSIANYTEILDGRSNIDELSDEEVNDILAVLKD